MWGTASNVNCCGLRIPLACPVTLLRTAGHPQTHAHMAEQPISLDGANGVSPGASNANVEGGDPVGDVVATIGPRATLASARDPEAVLNPSGRISRSASTTRSLAWPCASYARRTAISAMLRLGSGPLSRGSI